MSGDTHRRPLPDVGRTLAHGRYLLQRDLRRGAAGPVLEASDQHLGRDVTVHLLDGDLAADPMARERFLREARRAARVDDPHVVRVLDVGDEDGHPYLVTERDDGPSLAEILARTGRLDPDDVIGIATDALVGLGRLHDVGLPHADLRPATLRRTSSGLVKVAEAGVALAGGAGEPNTAGGVVEDPYLAPERRRGGPASVPADLYGLGVTLVELLTSHPSADPEETAAHGPEMAGHLGALLEGLLAEAPQERPASAGAALRLLAGDRAVPRHADAATHGEPAGGRAERRGPAGGGEADAGETDGTPHDGETGEEKAPAVPWRLMVAGAVGLLVIALSFQLTGGAPTLDAPPGVERTDDPAQTARNLAEWLEDRAGQ